jgi:hypothetical protein
MLFDVFLQRCCDRNNALPLPDAIAQHLCAQSCKPTVA